MVYSNEIEDLVSQLTDPIDFAETHCDWYDTDYYDECEEIDGDWYPIDGSDYSLWDSASDAIRAWANESEGNLQLLREAVKNDD